MGKAFSNKQLVLVSPINDADLSKFLAIEFDALGERQYKARIVPIDPSQCGSLASGARNVISTEVSRWQSHCGSLVRF